MSMTESSENAAWSEADAADAAQLRAIGYEPVLSRKMSGFGNFAISFSIISILSGCMTLFGFGMATGGPAVMVWGWIGVTIAVLLIGLSLAEVTSVYPTSGALFFMAHRLGGKGWGWITGWLNMLGLFGVIAGIDYGAAEFIGAFTGMAFGWTPDKYGLIAIFAGVLLLHGVLNTFGVRVLDLFNRVSVWWHLLGVAFIVAVLFIVPAHHQSASFVFTHYVNATGFKSAIYVSAIGLLLTGYTLTGYDASAHMSEETSQASTLAPKGIVRSIWVSGIAGLVLLIAFLFSIQGGSDQYATESSGSGYGGAVTAPSIIMLDALGQHWAEVLTLVIIIAQLCCGLAAIGSAARMVFAFSRDGALPGSPTWRKVNRSAVPTNAMWLVVVVAFLLTLPSLWTIQAYGAVTAIASIGLAPAYVIPGFLRARQGKNFKKGAWNLGKWGPLVGYTASVWVVIEVVLFCLPQASPVTALTFNYAPIALVGALLLSGIWWLARGRASYAPPAGAVEAEQFADLDVI
ncbi:amino acid permease [Catenulispora rubra]|uniref:amino acid permease n=1 Tax=Catenulispora rubra TaxID=280293 RepID=UPI00189240E0|nr:amino acid permease [Catenulispora rubra]